MALISPGIDISVVDESQYVGAAVGTIPMLVIATAQNKTNPTSGGTAAGTTKANAEKTHLIGSQRELVSTFGEPTFYKSSSGTSLHGYELNEYGLMSAYSLLGSTNRAYILRADIDLGELEGQSGRPTSRPLNGTHWFDTRQTKWGIFEWNNQTKKFINKVPTVITDDSKVDNANGGAPLNSEGEPGDYAINATMNDNKVYVKNASSVWNALGSNDWYASFNPSSSNRNRNRNDICPSNSI